MFLKVNERAVGQDWRMTSSLKSVEKKAELWCWKIIFTWPCKNEYRKILPQGSVAPNWDRWDSWWWRLADFCGLAPSLRGGPPCKNTAPNRACPKRSREGLKEDQAWKENCGCLQIKEPVHHLQRRHHSRLKKNSSAVTSHALVPIHLFVIIWWRPLRNKVYKPRMMQMCNIKENTAL